MIKPQRPWIAVLLSLAMPGLGHLYAGHPGAAVVAYVAAFAALGFMLGAWLLVPIAPANILLGLVAVPAVYLAIPIHAAILARRRGANYRRQPYNRWYVYLGVYLIAGVLVSDQVRQQRRRYIEAFRIAGGAMEPTLLIGDHVYVLKRPGDRDKISNGSIVAFESFEEPGLKIVKRVVGLPGDTVEMRAGKLHRNGQELVEPYVSHRDASRAEDPTLLAKMRAWQVAHTTALDTASYAPDLENWRPVVVPPDSFLALGDNRDASYDSRHYGFIPLANVIGRPRVIYFSLGDGRVRWSRIGQWVE